MTRAQQLQVAAGVIRSSVADLATLIQLLEGAGQKKLAAMLAKPPKPAKPPIPINGRPHPNAAMWMRGRL
jgi:hypothetical protein